MSWVGYYKSQRINSYHLNQLIKALKRGIFYAKNSAYLSKDTFAALKNMLWQYITILTKDHKNE